MSFPHPPRILVVDDHPNAAFILAQVLKGIMPTTEIITAHSGEEALDLVDDNVIDIVITDFLMPGINGLELVEKLKQRDCAEPAHTILITAYDVPGLSLTARQSKVDSCLTKPVDPEKVRAIVRDVLGSVHPPAPHLPNHNGQNQFKILIADDNPDNVHLLATRLRSEGYNFITASDGEETLEKIWREMPDLVLLDVNMPKKSGFEVLQEVRANAYTEHIQVMIVTAARTQPKHIRIGLNLGADDYVTKPFDWRELAARIRSKLRVKRVEDALRRRNQELALLPELAQDLSARLDIDELAKVVLERTVLALAATNGHLVIFNSDDSVFQKLYSQGKFSLSNTKETREKLVTEGLISHVVATRQGAVVADTRTDSRWLKSSSSWTRSAICAPLLGRHAVIGTLTLTHKQENYFRAEHLTMLQAIASQGAIAVENAQLYTAMEQEQERLAAVLHAAADAILVTDAEGRLQSLNPAAFRLFANDIETRLNQPLPSGAGYDDLIALLDQAQRSGLAQQSELTWPDERVFNVQVTLVETGGIVAVLNDVTHFKHLGRVKDEFIATASHDLKNPIASILLSTSLLQKMEPLSTKQIDIVGRVQNAATRMSQLVHDLLDLARTDLAVALDMESLNLYQLLDAIVEEFRPQAESKRQILELLPIADQIEVAGDKLRLQQVIRNLVGNAIKYTLEDGHITISTVIQDANVRVSIQDTGIGIPQVDLPYVFDTFYRVHMDETQNIEGNGLGLAIVKSIVEQHGGQMSVESVIGQGSCFNFMLPLATLPEHAHL
ncbi:MAG: response regulator [Chloroflexi bacterium]|nr:response regulator [Chloroflexota bacterium]